ncbi:MAG: tetratricopeptide repeat protein [Pirellulales bacterium]|nr:tetratricopeptide repeat protein [Pirellulales bacterium]
MSRQRFTLAEEQLALALADVPDDPLAHALLALCLTKREAFVQANEMAKSAVQLAPDFPYAHFMVSFVLCEQGRFQEAIPSLREALRLDPTNAMNYGLAAMIDINRGNWQDALNAAERGLECDPHNKECANLRAACLTQLGDVTGASDATRETLTYAPDSSVAHSVRGWAQLLEGHDDEALVHFREALRLDPMNDNARQGIVESLKAKHWPYRALLIFQHHASRAKPSRRGLIAAALPLLFAIICLVVVGFTDWQDFGVYAAVVAVVGLYLAWAGEPISNLFLRFHPDGRLVLSPDEFAMSNWAAFFLGGALLSAIFGMLTGLALCAMSMLLFLMLVINAKAVYRIQPKSRRGDLAVATALLSLFAVASIVVEGIAPTVEMSPQERKDVQEASFNLLKLSMMGLFFLAILGSSPRIKR